MSYKGNDIFYEDRLLVDTFMERIYAKDVPVSVGMQPDMYWDALRQRLVGLRKPRQLDGITKKTS